MDMKVNQYKNQLLKENEKILILLLIFILCIIVFIFILMFNDYKKNKIDKKTEQLYFENINEKKEIGRLHTIEEKKDNIYLKIDYPEIGNEKIDKDIKKIVDNKIDDISNKYYLEGDKLTHYYFMQYEIYVGNSNIISFVLKDYLTTSDLTNVISNNNVYYFNLEDGKELKYEDIFEKDFKSKLEELIGETLEENTKFILKNNKIVLIGLDKEINIEDVKDWMKNYSIMENDYSNTIKDKSEVIVNRDMVVLQDIVLYDSDSLNGKIIKTISKDEILHVHKNISNGFSMIFLGNGIGYVETRYLKDKPVVNEQTGDNSNEIVSTDRITLYVTDSVILRSEMNKNSKQIAKLVYGDKVVQTGETKDWLRIEYQGMEGYIKKGYTSDKEVVKHKIPINVSPQTEIDETKPMVALTFDDGPNNTSTVKILDVLEKYNARATFFDLGSLMIKYPEVVKREATLGEVGTHTYSHTNLNTLSVEALKQEINNAKEAYKQVLGEYPVLMRPPYGSANGTVKQNVTDMALINWNVDSLDWKYRNKDLTLNEIYKYGDFDGKIILLHSIHAATADTVEILVPELISRGYQLVTVSELAKYKGYTLETGTIYHSFK